VNTVLKLLRLLQRCLSFLLSKLFTKTPTFFKLRGWKARLAWVLALCLLWVLLLQLWFALHLLWWKWLPVQSTAFMEADLAKLQAVDSEADIKHIWADYADISDHIKRAVITSEDAHFEDHEGVDWEAIQKAREKNAKRGKVVAGGSTITMQLAKNLFLSAKQSYSRKAQELVITYMLEAMWDKQRILEVYLNSAEFGKGVFGVQAGAKHHFGVSAKQLSAEQAARMAAMLPRPKFYDKNRGSAYLQKRTQLILRQMGGVDIP
jgi:monofunctional glycosyltransferase